MKKFLKMPSLMIPLFLMLAVFISACTNYLDEFQDEYGDRFDDNGSYADFDLVAPSGLGNDFYCEVKEKKSSVTQEMYYPGMMWSSLEFSYKSDGVYATLIEVFYDAFTMSTDSICADAAEDMDEYEPGSFKCGKGGVTFVVKHTTSEAMTKDQFAAKATGECDKYQDSWNKLYPTSSSAKSSSSVNMSSFAESSSSAKSSSSEKSSSSVKSSSSEGSSTSKPDSIGTCSADYDLYNLNEPVVWHFAKDPAVSSDDILESDFEWSFGSDASPKNSTKIGSSDSVAFSTLGYKFPTLRVTLPNGDIYNIDCEGIIVVDAATGVYEDDYSVTDLRDGHEYYKVKIGKQVWMSENMKYDLPGEETYCYDNNDDNCDLRYGRLYSWSAAQKVCPTGWHLPSKDEWDSLYTFVESDIGDSSLVGAALKSEYSWNAEGAIVGTDNYRFSAWAAGLYTTNPENPGFVNKNYVAGFWTSTMSDSGVGYGMVLIWNMESLYYDETVLPGTALSVRCLKDK